MNQRRQRRTHKEQDRLIRAQARSGATVSQFCAEHDIGVSTFDKWKRRYREAASAKASADFQPVRVSDAITNGSEPVALSKVTVTIGAMTLTIEHAGDVA